MNDQQIFTLVAVLGMVMIAVLLIVFRLIKKEAKALSPLAGLAFAFIVAGIVFGEERWLGYGLIGVGVIMAVIDMVIKLR
jgi:hypothetical protein